MSNSVYHIPTPNLLLALSLVLLVILIHARWSLQARTLIYATVRMILQLVLVGFALIYIFNQKSQIIICLVLSVMLIIASWISLHPIKALRRKLYTRAFLSLFAGCTFTLIVIVAGVIRLTPWYEPRYLIPLAGMIFANAMNALSLAAERFQSEVERNVEFTKARAVALQAGMLPLINSFFAVGLVSLPGMMTGQILAGVSPLVAVRYQVMVMCMLFGASGISTAIYLSMLKHTNVGSLES